ncbi:helix-turn-helix domain-containing protein [Nocardia sp. bgisy118]|uniref:helix-turn-helix domain-containing protein n=1 Tax=Nocardia sp. bgisy118 TaxID=3413786 RepID=UPI003F4A24D8
MSARNSEPTRNERLREAMREAGLTPQSLAERLEVDQKTVERWISRGRIPYPKHQHSVSVAVGVSADDLWPDRPDKPVNERLQLAVFEAGMTPEQLARKLHVTPTQVHRWIQRGTVPYPRHQSAVAEAVQVPEDQLWPDRLAYHRRAESEFRLHNSPLERPSVRQPVSGMERGHVESATAGAPGAAGDQMRALMSWVDSTAVIKERDIHPHLYSVPPVEHQAERPARPVRASYGRSYGVERSR